MRKTSKNLYLYESGSPSNPTILFLHGSPLSARMWQPQLELLSDFHCLAPDLPEHGFSADIMPFDMAKTVKYLADLIRRSSPNGRAHVVGLSFGSAVAQALMVYAPDVVDHVILSSASVRYSRSMAPFIKAYLWLTKPFIDLLHKDQLSSLAAWQYEIPAQYRAMLGEDIKKVPPSALTDMIMASYTKIVTPDHSRWPVLVVVGQKEIFLLRNMARQITHIIRGARGVLVSKGGHIWNLQFPNLFADMVRQWVTDKPLPAGLLPLE